MRKSYKNLSLKQQIAYERKKKDIFFFLIIGIAFFYVIITAFFGNRGLIKYYELKDTEKKLKAEIESLQKDNSLLKSQVESLKQDSFLREKYAREKFGLAKPEEYIYQFKDNER